MHYLFRQTEVMQSTENLENWKLYVHFLLFMLIFCFHDQLSHFIDGFHMAYLIFIRDGPIFRRQKMVASFVTLLYHVRKYSLSSP